MTLATADAEVAQFLIGEVERAALERLEVEGDLSVAAVAAGDDMAEQRLILTTWASWYDDALAAMTDIEVGGSSEQTLARVTSARAAVAEAGRTALEALGG